MNARVHAETRTRPEPAPRRQAASAPRIGGDVLRSSGQPLDAQTRTLMESHLGHDFGRVRVYADGRAAESARAVGTSAYTLGHQVVFGAGQYRPRTSDGRRLLAHELTHVVQQTVAPGSRADAPEGAAEAEARGNAEAMGRGQSAGVHLTVGRPVLQRQPAARDEEVESILAAAARARRAPDDRTGMVIRGAEITYRLIRKYVPGYSPKVGGVGYDARASGVTAVKVGRDSISVTVGRDFILGTEAATLDARAGEVERALERTGVPPDETAAETLPEGPTASEAPAPEAATPAASSSPPEIAEVGKWSSLYGSPPKTYVGVPYETYKAGLGTLKATTEGGIKGATGRGTPAAPEISFEVLKKAYPGMAADVAADPKREAQARAYLKSLNTAFATMKIDTVEAQANYLAHAYIESDQFRQFIETQGWLNAAQDPAKRVDQKWITDPEKLRLDTDYLERTYNPPIPAGEENDPKWAEVKRRKQSINPGGAFEFLGRGPVQVTHRYNYMEVIAMLEIAAEHYGKAAKDDPQARQFAALAREAANAVKADPRKASDPKYTFLFSAAYMKRTGADVSVAGLGAGEKWTGTDAGSAWVAGAKQTQKPQVAALKEKQGAYERILPVLMCEARKAGIDVDPKYQC